MITSKSVSEIIAGALELMTRGPKGERLKKAAWIKGDAVIERAFDSEGNPIAYKFCALGALSAAAEGVEAARDEGFYGTLEQAGNLVAEQIPEKYKDFGTYYDIPEWNDNLSKKHGFRGIKRAFCKALKVALDKEQKRGTNTRKRASKRSNKRNARTK